jgi:hypothetical protein
MGDATWVGPFEELMPVAREIRDTATTMYVEREVLLAKERHQSGGTSGLPYGVESQIREEATRRAGELFGDIPDRFLLFVDAPDPAGFDTTIQSLTRVQSRLATTQQHQDPLGQQLFAPADVFSRIDTTAGFLSTWSGLAAHEFKADYLDRMKYHTSGQFNLAAVLVGATQAERAIWQAARSDVRVIAAEGLAALEQLGDCTQAEWTISFTVVASVVAVAAAAFTGGASVALAAVAGAAQVAATVPLDEPVPTDFSGDSPEEVVQEIRRGVDALIGSIHEAEEKIATALRADASLVNAHWAQFVAGSPSLADATELNVRSDDYMGFAR